MGLTAEDLRTAIDQHERYVRTGGVEGVRFVRTEADMRGVRMGDVVFRDVVMQSCDLRHANFRGATLAHALLANSNFRFACLAGADMHLASLVGVDLRNTDLTGAKMRGVRLDDAMLGGAELNAADFTDARFHHTTGLRAAQFRSSTILPTGETFAKFTTTVVPQILDAETANLDDPSVQLFRHLHDAGHFERLDFARPAAGYSL